MLAGLDDLDWRSLAHAHGVASDVPGQLRTVAGGSPQEVDMALYELYGNLWNEGSVYPATAAAVPFLGELAASSELAHGVRVELLVLLARLGCAEGGEARDRRAVRAALGRLTQRLEHALEAPEAELRVATAGVVAALPRPPAGWAPMLRALAEAAPDPVVRAHYAVAAALAADRQPAADVIGAAAAVEPYLARWRERRESGRFEGLVAVFGRRLGRKAAADLSLTLTELALERA